MNILGLVTEYNPFHNGHLYHLRTAREMTDADLTIAVMSGHFLQRGLPALTDKWTRAEMAVRSGVDLVVELPVLYACSSAEAFAAGSVALLDALGATDICFGSESGRLEPIQAAAQILAEEPPPFREALRLALDQGVSFPEAREAALKACLDDGDPVLKAPNNILGVEYCKALIKQNSVVRPWTLTRIGTGYHSTAVNQGICSATAIRSMVRGTDATPLSTVMPPEAAALMNDAIHQGKICSEERLYPVIRYLLLTTAESEGLSLADNEHGLWNRLTQAARSAPSLEALLNQGKTRHYARTRLQRVLAALLLGIRQDTRQRLGFPRYARILGASPAGRSYLKAYGKSGPLPVITNLSRFRHEDPLLQEMLRFDLLATDLFAMGLESPELRTAGRDYLIPSPFMLEG